MFCPQCGHQQVTEDIRFCSRCGLSLGIVTDLLINSDQQFKRQKREITGIGLMMATVLMLMNFVIVFGAVTLPHLANPVFFWIWLGFVVSSLIIGGLGLVNLIRGGFFSKLKEREARLGQIKLNQASRISSESKDKSIEPEGMARLSEPASVTETTTRELASIPITNRKG